MINLSCKTDTLTDFSSILIRLRGSIIRVNKYKPVKNNNMIKIRTIVHPQTLEKMLNRLLLASLLIYTYKLQAYPVWW